MVSQPSAPNIASARIRALGPILSEALALLLTIVLGIVGVALVIFLPRAFLGDQAGLGAYMNAVSDYLAGVLRGDLGLTVQRRPVTPLLLVAARRSLELLGVSLGCGLLLGLGWGALLAGVRRGWLRAVLFGLSTLLISLPTFAVLLLSMEAVSTLTLRTGVRLTYVYGYGLDQHLLLPAGALALRGAAYMGRAMQVAHEDILQQDWIRVARAKGLGGLSLWWRHVLPALWLPLLGSTLGMIRVIVNGFVIVDYLSGWGGVGRQMLEITNFGTISPAEGELAAGAALMFVLFFVLIDALGRVLLRRADPRLREVAAAR
jgi:ABC-type dipeptide/oligopeptide/nickel transport system permease component